MNAPAASDATSPAVPPSATVPDRAMALAMRVLHPLDLFVSGSVPAGAAGDAYALACAAERGDVETIAEEAMCLASRYPAGDPVRGEAESVAIAAERAARSA